MGKARGEKEEKEMTKSSTTKIQNRFHPGEPS
jgi:hypothetical protein